MRPGRAPAAAATAPVVDPDRTAPGPDGRADPDRVSQLYAAHRLGLVRLAVLLVDDTGLAEDVVQDAFAGFVRRAPRVRDEGAALAYLRTSVVNGARSVLRRRRTARTHEPPHDVAPTGPDDRTLLADEHREVIAALRRLPDRRREVLVLRYWSGLPEADIATTLEISRGTVKSTASRALAQLEQILSDQNREGSR